jgi:hypothetical protein
MLRALPVSLADTPMAAEIASRGSPLVSPPQNQGYCPCRLQVLPRPGGGIIALAGS